MAVRVDSKVHHKLYGAGEVTKITEDKLYVSFGGKNRIFPYPEAFDKGYLSTDEPIAIPVPAAIPEVKATLSEKEDKDEEVIVDVVNNNSYEKIYEAINATVGTDYTGWMKACWPSNNPDLPFRLWFIQLAKTQNGKLVPAANDCLNTISADWNEVVYDDLKNSDEPGEYNPYLGYSLIFAKEPNGSYVFCGTFISDMGKSHPNHHVFKRVGTKVKLIGKPAHDIEILDDFRQKG